MAYDDANTRLKLLEPKFCDWSTASAELETLTSDEVESFKTHGYFVKRNLIKEKNQLQRIVEYTWHNVPDKQICATDPHSWLNVPANGWCESDAKCIGQIRNGNWKMRSPGAIGTEDFILKATAQHPNVQRLVRQLIGDPIRPPNRVRGVYVILPKPSSKEGGLGPHVDHAAAQLSAMVLLAKTPPRCGGFTIWPGSHSRLHTYWKSCYHAHWMESRKADFDREFRSILETVHPLEFCGDVGDVVFWHPRLIHSAGVNYSMELESPCIRFVVPCDFQHDGLTFFDDDTLGPSDNAQWWVCTRHFEEDPVPTQDNIWHDWAFNVEEEQN